MRVSAAAAHYATIRKDHASFVVSPNLADYEAARATFRWEAARKGLSGLPRGRGLNIAYEAVDRHAWGPRADREALRWIGKNGEHRDYCYRELALATNRFANVLQSLGVKAGDTVFVLLGRVPELYFAVLGAMKMKCVVTPLFSAFG
ncbi:MAG: AMP-binding protein, partial [Methylocystis sp.]